MARQRLRRLKLKFNLIGIKTGDYLHGVVRIDGRNTLSRTNLVGLSYFFDEDPDGKVTFYESEPFFYDTAGELLANYRAVPRISFLDQSEFQDKPNSGKRQEGYLFNGRLMQVDDSHYLMIPLESMCLEKLNRELVDEATEKAQKELSDLLDNMKRVDLADNRRSRNILGSNFGKFPKQLKESAEAANHFYRAKGSRIYTLSEAFYLPPIRLVSTPMGGLPEWAKQYWKRERSRT